jgi:hypothetical protein
VRTSRAALVLAVLVGLFRAGSAANPAVPHYATLDAAARASLVRDARAAESMPQRLLRVSAPFLGTPYTISPLGEGTGVDADPRVRYDAVDCVTFVETVLALAAAPTAEALLPVLDDIRYAATPPAFQNRNHFVEAQWVPNNLLKGWLKDVARDVAGDAVQVATKVYGPERWQSRHKLDDMPLDTSDIPRGTFRLNIVPFAFAVAHPEKLPAGALLFVVRKDFYTQPTRVTHVGLLLDTPAGKVLRHASKEPYHRVVDEPIAAFLGRNAKYAKWPVEGFALYELQVPAARVAALAAPTGTLP